MELKRCRICGNENLEPILDLGEMPLVNSFLDATLSEVEYYYPLRLVWCESCGLLQIDEIVPPAIMFRDYIYVSGTSETMRKHFLGLAFEMMMLDFKLNSKSLVVDIGSNDGTLLYLFKRFGVKILGVDPAVNIAKIAEERGIKTVTEFFSEEIAMKIVKEYGKADAITATNVVAHTNNLDDLLKGITYLLKDEGVFVLEVPYLLDLLESTEFDTIYHEHLSYFALRPLKGLFERHNLKIVNVDRVPIHGGTIRVFVSKEKASYEINESVSQLMLREWKKRLDKITTYREFAGRVEKLKSDLVGLLQKLKSENKKVIGYGAAAKGNVLLNYYHIGSGIIEFIADLNPMKQGKFTPGTHIPVCSPERIYEANPDYMLILAWNFADEIMEQQAEFKERGGKFIIPIPKVKVIGGGAQ